MARHRLRHHPDHAGRGAGRGLAQALAVLPGVSRSGSTITAGLFVGLKREAAARFSFLLGTPIIVGSGMKKGYDVLKAGGIPADQQAGFAIGFVDRRDQRLCRDLVPAALLAAQQHPAVHRLPAGAGRDPDVLVLLGFAGLGG